MNRLRLIKTAYTALAALMLTACASDELTDGTVQDLPEGAYPLQIASVSLTAESSAEPWGANAPQTRVSENTTDGKSSEWNVNDVITVQLSGKLADGKTSYKAEGKYKLNSNKTSLSPVSGEELYWHSTSTGTVTAWHCSPAASGNTVALSNQRNGLAYVLKAAEVSNVAYNTSPSLSFSHQLAKVRVKLTGDNAADVITVKVKGYPFCTINQSDGTVTGSGTETYLSMIKNSYTDGGEYWEANVVPGRIDKTDFLQVNGAPVDVETTVTQLDAAKYYVFNIEVKPVPLIPVADGETITEPGGYIVTGTITQGITLSGDDIDLTLNGVTSNTKNPIKIEKGTPTIILQGNNSLTASDAPAIWLTGESANVIIRGTEGSYLEVSSTNGSAAIGTIRYIPLGQYTCGNITIEDASIKASSQYGAAAIGTGGGFHGSGTCGVITIIKSDFTGTTAEYSTDGSPAVIGTGGTDGKTMHCKGINITLKDGQTKDTFIDSLTGSYTTKVGAGEALNGASNTCDYVNWYNADGTPAN